MNFGQKKRHSKRPKRVQKIEPTGALVGVPLPIRIEHFDGSEEIQIKSALEKLFSDPCSAAFRNAHLKTPLEVAQQGVVFRPSTDLINYSGAQLNLVSDATRLAYREQFFGGKGTAQAGTIPAVRNGVQLTTDGSTQIYLDRA